MNPDKQFSISETVNRNIEKHQFPHYRNHKSLVGWCTMNYPKVLQNPKMIPRPQPKEEADYERKAQELQYQFQVRPKEMKMGTKFDFKKPFQTHSKFLKPIREEKVGAPPDGFKSSGLSLTTAGYDARKKIVEELNQNQKCSAIYPLKSEIPKNNYNEDYCKKIRQIGEISYQPSYQSEEFRHLKKLPNSVLTEQNMLEIMNPELKYMNLHNHTWIPNDLISKIGYFATNIESLKLSETQITDEVLQELSISCEHLHSIDISNCRNLTAEGVKTFLEKKKNDLVLFASAYNDSQITDFSLQPLLYSTKLEHINLSYCSQITDISLQFLVNANCKFKEIHLSCCPNIKSEFLEQIIQYSKSQLIHFDISFNSQKELGKSICQQLKHCQKLEQLILTGCINIADDGLNALVQENVNGFQHLTILKLGGCEQIGDNALGKMLQISPALTTVELNNNEKLSEYTLNQLTKNCLNLKKVLLNFTPSIEDQSLASFSEQFPYINFIRTINGQTDIKDDGLRMPYPLESKIKVKPKKKKKK